MMRMRDDGWWWVKRDGSLCYRSILRVDEETMKPAL